jgi:LPXTG-site transpeptidase (sortase) family protein
MKSKTSLLSRIGSLFILVSFLGFALILYPLIFAYILPPQLHPVGNKGTFIVIPKIHAEAPVILNVDPWNEAIYKKALQQGVAHAKGTSLPGNKGTTYLFAHSSGMPWEMTRYNTIFLRLSELRQDDIIQLSVDGKRYKYKVKNEKIVPPTAVSYLINSTANQLILQTCTPIGTSLNRLLIFAAPV